MITIKAQNDGKAVIDGEVVRVPATIGRWAKGDNVTSWLQGLFFRTHRVVWLGYIAIIIPSADVLQQVPLPGQSSTSAVTEYNLYGGSFDTIENCFGWGGAESASLSVHSQTGANYACHDNRILGSIFFRAGETPSASWGIGISLNQAGGDASP